MSYCSWTWSRKKAKIWNIREKWSQPHSHLRKEKPHTTGMNYLAKTSARTCFGTRTSRQDKEASVTSLKSELTKRLMTQREKSGIGWKSLQLPSGAGQDGALLLMTAGLLFTGLGQAFSSWALVPREWISTPAWSYCPLSQRRWGRLFLGDRSHKHNVLGLIYRSTFWFFLLPDKASWELLAGCARGMLVRLRVSINPAIKGSLHSKHIFVNGPVKKHTHWRELIKANFWFLLLTRTPEGHAFLNLP